MKKFYVFAAVAIAALASCTKSEVVYDQGQQEIGFRQFTGAMTKAVGDPTNLSELVGGPQDMGVFAYIYHSDPYKAYFSNAKFVKKNGNKWGGENPYYWPLQDSLDFVLYAPYQSDNEVTYAPNNKTLEVTITDNNTTPQTDYLYGKTFYEKTAKPETPSNGVPVVLKHALSKVTITAKTTNTNAASIFTVKSIKLMQTIQKGSYTVTYSTTENGFTSNVKVSPDDTYKKDMEYVSSESGWSLTDAVSENTTASKLVVPSAQTKIVLTYTMAGNEAVDLTATVKLTGEWETGKHYTYNLILTADEILFDPSVEDWDNQTASDKELK